MSWLGLRIKDDLVLDPDRDEATGQSQGVDEHDFHAQGTILCQFEYHPVARRQNLLRYAVRSPWPSSLIICADPDGTFHLLQGQSDRSVSASVQTDLIDTDVTLMISVGWDAPARLGVFTVFAPDLGALYQTEFRSPLPLSKRDVSNLLRLPTVTLQTTSAAFLAVSDAKEPVGPSCSIEAGAAIRTPYGATAIEDIRPGSLVLTHGGDVAQVRWVGSQLLPAAGRHTPMMLRDPYYDLCTDLVVSTEARLMLNGSEIEYLFGEEAVSVSVGHLGLRKSIARVTTGPLLRYFHVLLDRPDVLVVNGAAVESLDASAVLNDRANLPHSVLADLPPELLPMSQRPMFPVLKEFEALSLSR